MDRLSEPGSLGRQPDAGLDPVPQVQAAMAHFERAINEIPTDPNLYYNLMQVSVHDISFPRVFQSPVLLAP